MEISELLKPGQRILHPDFGEGIVVDLPINGYIRAFFGTGERQVPVTSLREEISRSERVISGVEGTKERLRQVWLSYEAHALPLMESAAALTAAKIDLLPHQVVLTHRIATAGPRRFLIGDEVGLGKTIETALILRELASRGELVRALMVVPAGLVNNWHRELNEVFNLNFEVFGSEGDVTDRKSNAFAKHNRLIASIDTLKRSSRVRRILEAPAWDLVVFDEAHHLTAYESGRKLRKTENYKLAESLKNHTRDLLLLSATPHQGDHFRFWMLIQLLNSTLFKDAADMVANRHRLNSVVYRRTKADACKPDGSALFARRWVHTESFLMSDKERDFYAKLKAYLEDGFELAKKKGTQGRGLGFVMAIFQKIAASSFAAVTRTLRRRLLALTIYEAVLRDRDLDIDGRQELLDEARRLIREEYKLGDDPVSRGEIDRILADLKLKIVKEIDFEELELAADPYAVEFAAAHAEEAVASAVGLALPQERERISELLMEAPTGREVKAEKLLAALGALWRQNSNEKVVIFATYLGTVDLIGREIESVYPGQGVVVLRGGDHGAKVAAEKRFKLKDGPRVLVCTAAGREGINLQCARVLFNFDLPWNPMDVEQRIGRIHRYGQQHTAQVYNLVLSDTIEGRIFLLLNDKLEEIARTLGKVDADGRIAEDLRAQILGQLSERLSYERLYQEALSDPELKRTKLELEAALANASEARKVVFELFQDLDGFSLDEYQPFADVSAGIERIARFVQVACEEEGWHFERREAGTFHISGRHGQETIEFTASREAAIASGETRLLGLDDPLVAQFLAKWRALESAKLGVSVSAEGAMHGLPAVLTWWFVETRHEKGQRSFYVLPLAVDIGGNRFPSLEKNGPEVFHYIPAPPQLNQCTRKEWLKEKIEPMLARELEHRGILKSSGGYLADLAGWVEIS